MKSDDSAMSGRARAHSIDQPQIVVAAMAAVHRLRMRSDPDCTGRCRYGISFGTSPCAAIRSSSMSRGWLVV